MTGRITVQKTAPDAEEVRSLLNASTQFMKSLYPDEWCHVMSVEELAGPEITFFAAQINGVVAGCGALARRDEYGEVKSMYVAPDARGYGLGRAILAEIVELARSEGFTKLRLETGGQLDAAVALYRAFGFESCPAFGCYPDVSESLFMELRL